MPPSKREEVATPDAVWVIDTSSILQVRRQSLKPHERERLYSGLSTLVEGGGLVFPQQVYDELKRGSGTFPQETADEPLAWATNARTIATRHGTDFEAVRKVLAKVSDVLDVDKTSGADEADPYVLGLALHLKDGGHEVTVVSEERRDRPAKMSMATACGLLRLYCVPLLGLVRDQGLG